MGYIKHHAIIVTGHAGYIEAAHDKAKLIFNRVTEITEAATNGYKSFLIPPDGSKEGWGESNRGNERRDEYVAWLRSTNAPWVSWVEISYPGDDDCAEIIRDCATCPPLTTNSGNNAE